MWLSHEFHQFFLKKTQVPNWSEKNPDDGLSRMSNFQAGISYDQSIIGTSGARICDVCVCVSTMHVYIYIHYLIYNYYLCMWISLCKHVIFVSSWWMFIEYHIYSTLAATQSFSCHTPPLDFPASPHACPQRQGHPVPSQHPATVAPWLHLQPRSIRCLPH